MKLFNWLQSFFKNKEEAEVEEAVMIACSRFSNYFQIRYNLTKLQANHFMAIFINSIPPQIEDNPEMEPNILEAVNDFKRRINNR